MCAQRIDSAACLSKIAEQELQVGAKLVVPGGEKPFVPKTVAVYSGPIPKGAQRGTGAFGWPASGSLSQQFWGGHRALDIASWIGNRVVTADSGFITRKYTTASTLTVTVSIVIHSC